MFITFLILKYDYIIHTGDFQRGWTTGWDIIYLVLNDTNTYFLWIRKIHGLTISS